MVFKTSLGISAKLISAGIAALFFAAIAWVWLAPKDTGAVLALPAILFLVMGISYYFSIRSYAIVDTKLEIRRPFDSIEYDLNSISSAARIDRRDLRFAVRTFGIGGLFSHTGQYWNKKSGHMTWYLTRFNTAVMLTIGSKKVVVSPDKPQEFINALGH